MVKKLLYKLGIYLIKQSSNKENIPLNWLVFERSTFNTKTKTWIIENCFYHTNLINVLGENDYRLKEIVNSEGVVIRKQLKLIGTTGNIDFPVKKPILNILW